MYDVLCDLFAERMPQDKSYKYRPDTVNVYFENRINATIHKVDVRNTIKEITADKKYVSMQFICNHAFTCYYRSIIENWPILFVLVF